MPKTEPDAALVRRERDLYLRILELGARTEMGAFLDEALALVVAVTGAENAYLEFRDESGGPDLPPWSTSAGFTEERLADVRAAISRGVIAEAVASGRTVSSVSALDDPRFRDRPSVQSNRVEAVLCVPIGAGPPAGVVYLQGRHDAAKFGEDEVTAVEAFARHAEPIARRFLAEARERSRGDATKAARAKLRADRIVGTSAALGRVLDTVALLAPLEVDVLLTGPTGCGKSEFARVIHANSPRAAGPFVGVNCAAIPETLFESEFFGAFPGAFTGATKRVHGKVETAEFGTLFIDEIGDLSLSGQVKLLHLVQDRVFTPLGGATPLTANVRIVAATNADLEAAVAAGRFREDLYYRLKVLPVRVPSLAERKEDLPLLVPHFVRAACARHRLGEFRISHSVMTAVENADWPGNLRELAHALEAAVIRCHGDGGGTVLVRHMFPESPDTPSEDETNEGFADATRRFQRDLLRQTLDAADWNVTEAARRLDLSRSHLFSLIQTHGLRGGGE